MISSPRISLSVRSSDADSVIGDERATSRVVQFVRRIREAMPVECHVPCEISVTETISSHCGLGSGTQLGLAVARAISVFGNEPDPGPERLARRVQRGLRSAIGLHGFQQGGFLVDGGRIDSNQLGTLVSRVNVPSDWRFVLAAPRTAVGLSGAAEQSAFSKQPPMPSSLTAELCQIVLMDWLPALIEGDFQRCSDSMYDYGHAVGEFFSPTQGGVFAHPRMAAWVGQLRSRGIRGVAQTSWGPTVVALCATEADATCLQRDFSSDGQWNDCQFQIASPMNHGATVSVT
jgi:beta-ribofuranosylaminobenzene 5'-phosphate synthase